MIWQTQISNLGLINVEFELAKEIQVPVNMNGADVFGEGADSVFVMLQNLEDALNARRY